MKSFYKLHGSMSLFKPFHLASKYKGKTPACPYCGGLLLKKGFKRGKQCYICKDCGKWCTGKLPTPTIKFKDINKNVHCPYCNSMNLTTSGFSKRGFRVYRCPSCNRRFTEEAKERKKYIEGETCPRCGSTNLGNKGVNKIGLPRYKCRDCKRSYTKGAKLIDNPMKRKPLVTEENKRKILMYLLNLKLPIPQVAEHFNCSRYEVGRIKKEYLTKNNLV